ncbi:MAG: pentapeptide repeat-containing protein [Paenibacillus sp.]|uniref:pentapeptide repeat-containing protein n=1 Tax=Paenibacillus sp. TaxID=58172 RepID=UPI0025D18A31|nr:pentapeptide repeat-containing protein [Paenibacillus sp.]MBR2566320.1 pentapeptide repeat-containing protein [Paenibacillus sp.]
MKIDKPKRFEHLLESEPIHALESKTEYKDRLIENVTLDLQEVSKASFERVVFRHVTLLESSLEHCEFTDVRFEHCDFSNVNLQDTFMHRTEWKNCKLVGADFSGSRWQNVSVLQSIADYSNFRFAHLQQVQYAECSLIGADFAYLKLQKIELNECKLDQVTFTGTSMKGLDLSDCEFDALTLTIEDLMGCVIAPYQAATFAGLMGLIIK